MRHLCSRFQGSASKTQLQEKRKLAMDPYPAKDLAATVRPPMDESSTNRRSKPGEAADV